MFSKFAVGFPYQHVLGAILSVMWLGFWWAIFGRITLGNVGLLLIGLAIAGMGANILREVYRVATGITLNPSVVEWWQGVHVPMSAMWVVNLIVLFVGCAFIIISKGTGETLVQFNSPCAFLRLK
ncbi:hypothetical protein MUP07_00850 [Candidatus Bathyarchaeota archaeon]|nr:hypothetical protein [Candidatus Bathyarchaeota archaeon]